MNLGVKPEDVYRKLNENSSIGALILQKIALNSMKLHFNDRVASQIIRMDDFTEANALPEDADGIVNIPLRARSILVSLMIKENNDGKLRCSLRSKGQINVSKIAQELGGGGHVNAAGFKSTAGIEKTLETALQMISKHFDTP